jgi:hypothetical protein
MIERSKEWWMRKAAEEGVVGAGALPNPIAEERGKLMRQMADKNAMLRAALLQMVEEKCDYMRINNLGDPETQHTVKAARAALEQ